jgi:hypothetical protein
MPSIEKLSQLLGDTKLLAGLDHYATPGIIPPSARVDPKLKIQPRRPITYGWKIVVFAISKCAHDNRLPVI